MPLNMSSLSTYIQDIMSFVFVLTSFLQKCLMHLQTERSSTPSSSCVSSRICLLKFLKLGPPTAFVSPSAIISSVLQQCNEISPHHLLACKTSCASYLCWHRFQKCQTEQSPTIDTHHSPFEIVKWNHVLITQWRSLHRIIVDP